MVPNLDLQKTGPVLDPFWISSKQFQVNGSRTGAPVLFGTVLTLAVPCIHSLSINSISSNSSSLPKAAIAPLFSIIFFSIIYFFI